MTDVYVALMYGQGGKAVDQLLSGDGLSVLAQKIRFLGQNVTCDLYAWDQGLKIRDVISRLSQETKIVIGGASLGANETPTVCSFLFPREIDFIFGCQPSLYGRKIPVPGNVKKALCIYAPYWAVWTLGFGSYRWQYRSERTKQEWMTSYMHHPGDNDPRIHDVVLAEVQRLRA